MAASSSGTASPVPDRKGLSQALDGSFQLLGVCPLNQLGHLYLGNHLPLSKREKHIKENGSQRQYFRNHGLLCWGRVAGLNPFQQNLAAPLAERFAFGIRRRVERDKVGLCHSNSNASCAVLRTVKHADNL
jgi:hypothetical protein